MLVSSGWTSEWIGVWKDEREREKERERERERERDDVNMAPKDFVYRGI